jgi:predicted small secreted protein
MTTDLMLHACNRRLALDKSGVKRLTIQGDLFSLGSTITVLQRRGGGVDPGIIEVPAALIRQQMRTTIQKHTEASVAAPGLREGGRKLALAVIATAAVAAMALSGCAGMPGFGINKDSDPTAKQKVVAERAEARWQSLIKGDLDAAYAYLSEGSKATTPLAVYKAKIRPGMWRQAKVEKVECEAEVCKVELQITLDHKLMKGIQTPLNENWIIEKGSAWYVYR